MLDFSRSEIWRGVIDASLSFFDVLEEAIDPASWPPGWELHYTDRVPEQPLATTQPVPR
jgi:hypothetical protein